MDINQDTIKNLLDPADFSFVYSEKAQRAFGMDIEEFEDAVEEYRDHFKEVKMANSPMLFHIKATRIIGQLNEFHEELDNVVQLQKASDSMEDMEMKAIMRKSKQVFVTGVNILAPYTALLMTATETKNIA